MKNYEELSRLKANEAIQSGLQAQRHQQALRADHKRSRGPSESRDDLIRRIFSEEGGPSNTESESRIYHFVLSIIGILIAVAVIAAAQGWLIP